MVQEVQQQGNWYQTPNRIEGIWVSERKVSDHTQVRADRTNGCIATAPLSVPYKTETKSTSRSISSDTVKYTSIGGSLYIPLPGTYLVKVSQKNNYSQSYSETIKIYNWQRVIYTLNTTLGDHSEHQVLLNLGRKNNLSVSVYLNSLEGNILATSIILDMVKL